MAVVLLQDAFARTSNQAFTELARRAVRPKRKTPRQSRCAHDGAMNHPKDGHAWSAAKLVHVDGRGLALLTERFDRCHPYPCRRRRGGNRRYRLPQNGRPRHVRPTIDSAMTRSEEQLHVGTERVQTGRARLRKYVVTEHETVTVPVTHEEVRLEREPITEGDADSALDGPAISDEEHEVVLSEERPVVEKEAVPVERVRIGTETVGRTETLDADVSKEEMELDDDTARGDKRH